jgi:Protein of unknown function (DUF3168)
LSGRFRLFVDPVEGQSPAGRLWALIAGPFFTDHVGSVSLRSAVVAALKANPRVSALIGARIFPGIVPQSQPKPALTVRLLSDVPGYNLSGSDGTSTARVEFTAVSKLLRDDASLADAIRNAFNWLSNTTLGGLPILLCFLDPEADDFTDPGDGTGRADIRTQITYLIRYRRPAPTRA